MVRVAPTPDPNEYPTTDADIHSYHTGRRRVVKERKRMIAWDSEGIDLDGPERPQSTVLIGCSAEPHSPLVIQSSDDMLAFEDIADYMLSVAARFPDCWHIGYFFQYDQNMIIKSLHWAIKQRLYENNSSRIIGANGSHYAIELIPGKSLRITRQWPQRQSIVIEDIGAFFATKFTVAYESLFPDKLDTPEYAIIEEGKKARGGNSYDDMPSVLKYWQAEIVALEELATTFRDLMWDNGFELQSWSGPGAFANYLRRTHKLIEHEWGGKEENIPPEVHEAAKSAFYGGRFEQFQIGRIEGPIVGLDINSAYPAAFCNIPSLARGGRWVQVAAPSSKEAFGIYHVLFREPGHKFVPRLNAGPDMVKNAPTFRAMPFPFRTQRDTIKFPPAVDGWYFTPEVIAAQNAFYDAVTVIDGWEWQPAETDSYPWRDLFEEMFTRRLELKAEKNPAQMVFKLGPNSMYGKMAQRVGWKRKHKAPGSHTLAIAGYITSYTRALIYDVVTQIPHDKLIAIETDGIYTTANPDSLMLPNDLGNWLGQWGIDRYDEMLYVQSGFYMMKENGKWKAPKTRGFPPDKISADILSDYLDTLGHEGKWPEFELESGNRFTTLGASIARSVSTSGFNYPKANSLHCTWFRDKRSIDPRGKGKRSHYGAVCPACIAGQSALKAAHSLVVSRKVFTDEEDYDGYPTSKPHKLPWEDDYKEPEWLLLGDIRGIG